MNGNPKEVLVKEFSDVLEHMAFLFAEPVAVDEAPPPSEGLLVSIGFSGPFQGRLRLAMPSPMSVDLAANFLGIEADEAADPNIVHDAIKELLNVTCGHVLTSLAGTEPVFSLAPPHVENLTPDAWETLSAGEHVAAFVVENSTALLRLDIDAAA